MSPNTLRKTTISEYLERFGFNKFYMILAI